MDETTYNKIKEKISKGMSVKEACGSESERTLFRRWRKRRHEDTVVWASKQQKAETQNKPHVPKYKEINQRTLDEVERYFFGALADEVQQGNPRVFRLMLDFLKARHPAYKETSRMFTPDDYKKIWEDVQNGKAQSSGNEPDKNEVPGTAISGESNIAGCSEGDEDKHSDVNEI